MASIPPEFWEQVFFFLDQKDLLSSVRLVCRQFAFIVDQSPEMLSRFECEVPKGICKDSESDCRALTTGRGRLMKFQKLFNVLGPDSDLAIMKHVPHATSLKIRLLSPLSPLKNFLLVPTWCCALENLDITMSSPNSPYNMPFPDQVLKAASSLHHLKKLSLSSPYLSSPNYPIDISQFYSLTLSELCLWNITLRPNFFAAIERSCPKLSVLSVKRSGSVVDNSSGHQCLTSLTIDGPRAQEVLLFASRCPNLQTLDIKGDPHCITQLSLLTSLQSLSFTLTNPVSESSILPVIQNNTLLTHLGLYGDIELTNEFFSWDMPSLRSLALKSSGDFSSDALFSFSQLTSLSIDAPCLGKRSSSPHDLPPLPVKSLTMTSVSPKFWPRFWNAISCSALTTFALHDCLIQKDFFERLSHCCGDSLRSLSLRFCDPKESPSFANMRLFSVMRSLCIPLDTSSSWESANIFSLLLFAPNVAQITAPPANIYSYSIDPVKSRICEIVAPSVEKLVQSATEVCFHLFPTLSPETQELVRPFVDNFSSKLLVRDFTPHLSVSHGMLAALERFVCEHKS